MYVIQQMEILKQLDGQNDTLERKVNNKVVIYGIYDDLDLARYVKTNLATHNWQKRLIKKFEKRYYLNKVETKYYYDSTDFFKT